MTQAPATGLYGPGDFGPDFVTIDELLAGLNYMKFAHRGKAALQLSERSATVTALLDLAHDLDARGLVLTEAVQQPSAENQPSD